MKCPNCSLPQPDGPACVRCQTPLGKFADEIKRADGGRSAPEMAGGLNVPPPESVVGALDELELGDKPKPAATATATQAPPAKPAAPAATPAPPAAPKPEQTAAQKAAVLKGAAPVTTPAPAKPSSAPAPSAPAPKPAEVKTEPTGVVSKAGDPADSRPSPAAMSMLITTGHDVPGRHMIKVAGVVSSQVLVRVGADQLTSTSTVQSLAGTGPGNHLQQGVDQAFMALRANAAKVGGDAVVSVQVNYCPGVAGGLMIAVTGTAVKLAPAG